MEDSSQQFGALNVRETAPIEEIPLEIFEQICSHLPRNDRLATSGCSRNLRRLNENFTWESLHVEIGDSSDFIDQTEQSKYLFDNLPYLYNTLLKYSHLGRYTVKLSLRVSRCLTYEMMRNMRILKPFSKLQELSLSPPPLDLELPVKASYLRLDFHYDRSTFWNLYCHQTPRLKLGPYFQMPDLRKLHIEHISFEEELHHDSFPVQEKVSPIEDLRFTDCSPQTVGILAKLLRSVRCLKRLSLEMNIPWPVVEEFENEDPSDWDRPGGQQYGPAISPHAESLEDLVIAFSDGASFFIRPFDAPLPRARISRMSAQPLVPPIPSLNEFIVLRRLAIPDSLLPQNARRTRYVSELLPYSLEELQLQLPVGTELQPLKIWGQGRSKVRLQALAEDQKTCFPRLALVILWFQQYGSSNPGNSSENPVHEPGGSRDSLKEAFDAVGVQLDRVTDPFFENTPFGLSLNISHARLRPPHLVRQGQFVHDKSQPGLYYDSSTQSLF